MKKSAEKFIKEALIDAKLAFLNSTNLPLSIAIKVLKKLKKTSIIAGFDERVMKNYTVESFHEDLHHSGEVSLFPRPGKPRSFNYIEMKYFGRKITTTPKNDERRLIFMKATADWFEILKPVEDYRFEIDGENLLCEFLTFFLIF